MYNRDKVAARRLPLYLLVLVICICSLAVHFTAEGLPPVTGSHGFDRAAQGEDTNQVGEQGEDNIILPFLTHLPFEHPTASLQCASAAEAHSLPISPLFQPPNS